MTDQQPIPLTAQNINSRSSDEIYAYEKEQAEKEYPPRGDSALLHWAYLCGRLRGVIEELVRQRALLRKEQRE